jgi:hypothetical protein
MAGDRVRDPDPHAGFVVWSRALPPPR